MKYVGKQKAVALAVMAMFASGAANAAVNLSASPAAPLMYPADYKIDDQSPITFIDGGAAAVDMDFGTVLGTALLQDKPYFFRFTLSAGEWDATQVSNFAASFYNVASSTSVTATVAPYVAPGSNNKAFVIGLTPTSSMSSADLVNIATTDAAAVVKSSTTNPIANGSTVKVAFTAHETQTTANNGTDPLSSGGGSYFTLVDPITKLNANTLTTQPLIDVATGATSFEAGTVTAPRNTVELCQFDIMENDLSGKDGTGTIATATIDGADTTTAIVVKGDFSAAAAADGTYDIAASTSPVYLSSAACAEDGVASAGKAPSALNATEAKFTVGSSTPMDYVDGVVDGSTGAVYVCMTVNGTSVIPTSTYSATYTPVNTTGYNLKNIDIQCNGLSKGGSSATVPMVVDVASQWMQLMRVTNPTAVSGNVHITAYNDGGSKFGPWSFPLDAGKSTGLISVSELMSKMPGIATTGGASTVGTIGTLNKLRLQVDAEFGSASGDDNNRVLVRTYVLPSTTNFGTFTQFQ